MAGGASSSDRLVTSFPLLETADWFQELSLGSDANEVPRNHDKGSLQHQYGHVPSGAYTAPSSHGSERRRSMNVGNVLNGGDPWGYFPANHTSGGYQDQSFGYGHNSNSNTFSHLMNPHSSQEALSFDQFGYNDHLYSNQGLYGLYGNVIDSGHAYGTFGYDSWKLGRGWYPVDGLNTTTLEKMKQDAPVVDLQRYNGESFPETLAAKFFVIKSYSEDDVHNSIKYGVWSSTPTGNKKLNAAYNEAAQECPVYLLFSVNASGQFVGVAEMIGPVDFSKTVEYWQQDKWIGCFPVKWHIIKDVPNSLLRHITLANNENKPVTNSRDTQEVNVEDGTRIIKIYKEYMSKTCILDDFKFYETRQKMIRDKKIKQKKQVLDGASEEMIHLKSIGGR
ncbi:hypothetical protein Bca52824_067765 [Brassica carinata]|uniref:YTH domain-containing family protein n=1 Tax=Brassica carinata TaxID=52824 RepID=A0A8X7UB80_BRACI|nr:hypothetical protein Bca52824_067765 [Brassica carinata]